MARGCKRGSLFAPPSPQWRRTSRRKGRPNLEARHLARPRLPKLEARPRLPLQQQAGSRARRALLPRTRTPLPPLCRRHPPPLLPLPIPLPLPPPFPPPSDSDVRILPLPLAPSNVSPRRKTTTAPRTIHRRTRHSSVRVHRRRVVHPWHSVQVVHRGNRCTRSCNPPSSMSSRGGTMVRPADPQRYRGGWPKPRPILESKAATGVTTWRQHGGRPGHWQSRGG